MAATRARRKPGESAGKSPDESLTAMDLMGEQEGEPAGLFDAEPTEIVRVHRLDDGNKKWLFHGRLTVEEANEERLAVLWGGGKYRIQLLRTTDDGRQVIAKTRFVDLPGPYRPPVSPLPTGKQEDAARPGPGVADVIAFQQGGGVGPQQALDMAVVSQVLDLMKDMKSGPRADWTPVISAGLTAVTGIVTAMLNRPREDNPALALLQDKLEDIQRRMEQPRTSPDSPAGMMRELLAAFRMMNEMRESVDGRGESDPMDKLLSVASRVLEHAPLNNGAGQSVAAPAKPGSDVPLWQQMIVSQRGHFLRSAALGVDPELAADVTMAYLPDQSRGIVLELLARPDLPQVVIQVIPEMGNYRHWLTQFVDALRAINAPEPGNDDPSLGGEEVTDDSTE